MERQKISESLAAQLQGSEDDELVEVVVELEATAPAGVTRGGGSRSERMAAVKEAFERGAQPLESEIESAGGEITGRAWINQTLKARVPKRAVAAVTDRREVRRLDVTQRIERD